MIAAFTRSWQLTKLTFGVMHKDPELLVFPLLGGLFSLLWVAALGVPLIAFMFAGHGATRTASEEPIVYVVAGALYFGLAFVATFFNTCTVYTTKLRLEGGDASLGQSLRFALSRSTRIAGLSLLAAGVGLVLRIAERAGERSGGAGGLVLDAISGLFGLLWSVLTIARAGCLTAARPRRCYAFRLWQRR
jgi:hypothetical protein